jgi:GxxExxY protein
METVIHPKLVESKAPSLARQVIGAAMTVHRILGCGFLESVYRKALAVELARLNIFCETHVSYSVFYQRVEIGVFQADLVIDRILIVELKAVDCLAPTHSLQLINYLAAAGLEEGLLLNFGAKSLEFRTKTRNSPSRSKIEEMLLP